MLVDSMQFHIIPGSAVIYFYNWETKNFDTNICSYIFNVRK